MPYYVLTIMFSCTIIIYIIHISYPTTWPTPNDSMFSKSKADCIQWCPGRDAQWDTAIALCPTCDLSLIWSMCHHWSQNTLPQKFTPTPQHITIYKPEMDDSYTIVGPILFLRRSYSWQFYGNATLVMLFVSWASPERSLGFKYWIYMRASHNKTQNIISNSYNIFVEMMYIDEITYPFPNFNGCTVEVWE